MALSTSTLLCHHPFLELSHPPKQALYPLNQEPAFRSLESLVWGPLPFLTHSGLLRLTGASPDSAAVYTFHSAPPPLFQVGKLRHEEGSSLSPLSREPGALGAAKQVQDVRASGLLTFATLCTRRGLLGLFPSFPGDGGDVQE